MSGAPGFATLVLSVAVALLAGGLALLAGFGFAVAAIAYTCAGIGVLLVATIPEHGATERAVSASASRRRGHG